jgi:hypothetical protein
MSKRSWLLVSLLVGGAVGAGATAWLTGTKLGGEAHAQPPEVPKIPMTRVLLQELTPLRKTDEAELYGGRDSTAIGSEYFVGIRTERQGTFRLTADSAAALMKFYQRCREVKPRRFAEIEAVALTWACEPYYPAGFRPTHSEGVHYEVSRLVGDDERFFFWVWREDGESGSVVFTRVMFDALAETLRDLERLKKIKPTVEP